jgi:molybdopterin-guanine dinucleotide biosynthesis protein A
MISNGHSHHHKSTPPIHQNEIGIWGIGCTALNHLYEEAIKKLPHVKIGYLDTKHHDVETSSLSILEQDKIHLRINQTLQKNQISNFFNTADFLLVNGNHSEAKEMWLVLDGKKPYKENLANMAKTSIIFYNEEAKDTAMQLASKNSHVQLIAGYSEELLLNAIESKINKATPALKGIVLTGGNSTRMQQNKSLLIYHKLPQWLHLAQLLEKQGLDTYLSSTEKNAPLFEGKPMIVDQISGFGPLSGIISSMLALKDSALLVLACDLPLIDAITLQELIQARDRSKVATVFYNNESGFLEPLIAIYEPRALPTMLQLLAQGYSCPRKMLMQCDILKINTKNTQALSNANFPEEREKIMKQLNKI